MSQETTSHTFNINGVELNFDFLDIWVGYEFEQDNCKLCHNPLSAPPLQELQDEDKKTIDMTVSVGKCGHIFHKCCIRGLKKGSNSVSCPVCNLLWKEEGLTEIGII